MKYSKNDLMPKRYPENKPSTTGEYICELINRTWSHCYWGDVTQEWYAGDDHDRKITVLSFIDISLDESNIDELEPSINPCQLESEENMSEGIWDTDELMVIIQNCGDVMLMNDLAGFSIDPDELTAFSRHWLDLQGYTVTRKEPEILPCPNPECGNQDLTVTRTNFINGDPIYEICCEDCGYRSPSGKSEAEAIRLHNLIARGSD